MCPRFTRCQQQTAERIKTGQCHVDSTCTLGAVARRVTATSIPLAAEANLYEDSPSLVGHLVGVGNGQQIWVWSLGSVTQLWHRWDRPAHQLHASGDTTSQALPFVDLITGTVETQISFLGAFAASPCDKVEAAACWAPRPHASESAVAATSLPCEDNAAARTKDKPFILTPRTHMGIFEKNGTSLVLHWRGCGEAASMKGTSHQTQRNQIAKTAAVGDRVRASLL